MGPYIVNGLCALNICVGLTLSTLQYWYLILTISVDGLLWLYYLWLKVLHIICISRNTTFIESLPHSTEVIVSTLKSTRYTQESLHHF